ncbi:proton-conducting transporter membrane subunit [Saccharicrinis sp. 156]|uniref:proton-conducting transporter transmembrane domain-containing protein n=1 Tax=Saccharicrinis sp. 156 TaxID=3417574 RepID=UPI003D342DE8
MTEIALPILLPLTLIIILIFIRSSSYAKWIGIAGSTLLLIVAVYLFIQVKENGILVLQIGGWEAPYGISLVMDYLNSIMLVTATLIVFAISIYAYHYVGDKPKFSRFFIFFFALIMGVNGAFITGDVFNLYVWLEVIMLSSFVLITMGEKKEQLEGGIKYMSLNLIASLLFLAGIGLLYGKTGTLNMAHLARILNNDQQSILLNTSAMLFFIALGMKAAIFPLFFWLPASYHTANITVTSLFAGLLTKVGVYALIRFFTLFFVQDAYFWHNLLLISAGFTMVIGGMAASIQYDTRRILSYHIISQIGYMVMGLGIYTPLALAGAIFFIIHNMIAKTNTFLVAGIVCKFKGTYYLKDLGGLLKERPLLAILFIIPAFALAGIPPLSGFFAKFILIKAGIEDKHYLITAVALLTAMLTLYSMIKIWNEAFLKKQPEKTTIPKDVKITFSDIFPSAVLALTSILLGVFAASIYELTLSAANQLLEPNVYIEAVLNRTK